MLLLIILNLIILGQVRLINGELSPTGLEKGLGYGHASARDRK